MNEVLSDPETVRWTLSTIAQSLAALLALAAMIVLFSMERSERLYESEFRVQRERLLDIMHKAGKTEYDTGLYNWTDLDVVAGVERDRCVRYIQHYKREIAEAESEKAEAEAESERARKLAFLINRRHKDLSDMCQRKNEFEDMQYVYETRLSQMRLSWNSLKPTYLVGIPTIAACFLFLLFGGLAFTQSVLPVAMLTIFGLAVLTLILCSDLFLHFGSPLKRLIICRAQSIYGFLQKIKPGVRPR